MERRARHGPQFGQPRVVRDGPAAAEARRFDDDAQPLARARGNGRPEFGKLGRRRAQLADPPLDLGRKRERDAEHVGQRDQHVAVGEHRVGRGDAGDDRADVPGQVGRGPALLERGARREHQRRELGLLSRERWSDFKSATTSAAVR